MYSSNSKLITDLDVKSPWKCNTKKTESNLGDGQLRVNISQIQKASKVAKQVYSSVPTKAKTFSPQKEAVRKTLRQATGLG